MRASRWARSTSCACRRRRGGTTTVRCPAAAGTAANRERSLWAPARGRHSSPSSRFEPSRCGDRGRRSLSRRHRDRPAPLAGPDAFGGRQARRSRRAGERRDSLAGRAARPGRTAGRAVNGRQGKARAARPPSPPSPRRPFLLTRSLPLKIPVSRSTTASIGPGLTTRASSWPAARRKKRRLAGRTGRRTISRVSKTCFPASGMRPPWLFPWRP